LPSENQLQVQAFLQQQTQWGLEEEQILLPQKGSGDGFYMARLKRTN
jgi:16S rRNA C967 or C1407 C5-methylase (RsmB/RsmF family)